MSPKEEVIISNSFEEIVFSNRNKEYGAYVLRKRQKKYILIAFLITFFMVSSSVLIPLISAINKSHNPQQANQGVIYTADTIDPADFDPPKPPELRIEPQAAFTIPVIVDSAREDEYIPSMDEVLDIPPSSDIPENIVQAERHEDDVVPVDDGPGMMIVEEQAGFGNGDINNFNKWVAEHIKYPDIASSTGISGKVFAQFAVNSKGKVVDVKILRGIDPSIDQEVVRAIESSPLWTPAKQGGRPVKQLFTLPVNFKMQQ